MLSLLMGRAHRHSLCGCLCLLLVGGLVGCGDDGQSPARGVLVDEQAGAWRSVQLGRTTVEQAETRFGKPPSIAPESRYGDDATSGPQYVDGPPRRPGGPIFGIGRLVYSGSTLEFASYNRYRIHAIAVDEEGTHTRAGAHIGQDLDDAADLYPGMRCVRTRPGHTFREAAYCVKKLGNRRWIAFGHDPVRTIYLSLYPIR